MVAFQVWAYVGGLATLFTLIWTVGERRITLMTMTSGVLWAWWGFQATQIRYLRDGTTYEESYQALVYIGGFLSLISLLALVMHRLDKYPPDSETDHTEAQPA